MELNHDWRSFYSFFWSKRKGLNRANLEPNGPVYFIAENNTVISSFAEYEDLSECIGQSTDQVSAKLSHRTVVFLDRKEVDEWMTGALALPHFYEQTSHLRRQVQPKLVARKVAVARAHSRHFLLESIESWWAKVLPSAYGVFIRLEGQPVQDFFMVVRRGKVDLFHEPDLSTMGVERSRQPEDVVKYLSEKHLVPVQGLFVPAREWTDWSESNNPWRKLALAVRQNRAKLVPFRWGVVTLVATRAFLSV